MDTEMYWRKASAGNLTVDEMALDLKVGPMVRPMAAEIIVPQDSALDSLDISIEFSVAQGGAMVHKVVMAQIPAAGKGRYLLPFFTNLPWARMKLDVTDGGGGVNYGAVIARCVPCGYDQQK